MDRESPALLADFDSPQVSARSFVVLEPRTITMPAVAILVVVEQYLVLVFAIGQPYPVVEPPANGDNRRLLERSCEARADRRER